MTQYSNKSFSVPCSSGATSQEELTRRWEATFGKKGEQGEQEEKEKEKEKDQQGQQANPSPKAK